MKLPFRLWCCQPEESDYILSFPKRTLPFPFLGELPVKPRARKGVAQKAALRAFIAWFCVGNIPLKFYCILSTSEFFCTLKLKTKLTFDQEFQNHLVESPSLSAA